MSIWLRGWVGVVSVASAGSSVMCFINKDYPKKKIYNAEPREATALAARLFGIWTLLASAVRLGFAIAPLTPGLYGITLFSFVLALFHFLPEVFIYRTSSVGAGTTVPFIVSSASIVWMIAEYLWAGP